MYPVAQPRLDIPRPLVTQSSTTGGKSKCSCKGQIQTVELSVHSLRRHPPDHDDRQVGGSIIPQVLKKDPTNSSHTGLNYSEHIQGTVGFITLKYYPRNINRCYSSAKMHVPNLAPTSSCGQQPWLCFSTDLYTYCTGMIWICAVLGTLSVLFDVLVIKILEWTVFGRGCIGLSVGVTVRLLQVVTYPPSRSVGVLFMFQNLTENSRGCIIHFSNFH